MVKKVMGLTLVIFYFLISNWISNVTYAEVVVSDDDTTVATNPTTVIESRTVPSSDVTHNATVAKETGRTVASTIPSDSAVVTIPTTERVVTTTPSTAVVTTTPSTEKVVVEHEHYGLFHVVGKILAFPFKLVGGIIETIF